MGAVVEVKFFNSFVLKKIDNAGSDLIWNGSFGVPSTLPGGYPTTTATFTDQDWAIEEARITGGFNNTSTDYGAKAYLVEEEPAGYIRFNALIYSGIFNSRTGINNTNVFSTADDIERATDPANGSIQKLYAEDTNLIIFQEDKVSRALIDKDAIYSAEGNAAVTSTKLVIGQIVPYAGEYGISSDPFSFAVYGYRKYFTDRKRGCVLRLSSAGEIIEISGYGMHDFFRDQLSSSSINKIIGGWDGHTKNYVISIQNNDSSYKTLAFDESVQGWTSFLSYNPNYISTLDNNLYTFFDATVWTHYNNAKYCTFYNRAPADASVTVVLNNDPSVIKNFKTFNYEGNDGWKLSSFTASSGDVIVPIEKYSPPNATSLNDLLALETNIFANNFKRKENKYFANLVNNSSVTAGEVLFGQDSSGTKGFFSTAVLTLEWSTTLDDINYYENKKELFAVSSDVVESSY